MQEIDRVKEEIGKVFAEFRHENWGYLTEKEKRKLKSWAEPILSLKIDGTTLKELIEDNTKSVKARDEEWIKFLLKQGMTVTGKPYSKRVGINQG